MSVIDLNSDLGESFGVYKLGMDEQVIEHISSANIACGFHAGDPQVMNFTVQLAKKYGVGVGAHPGFADLFGFGRRKIDVSPEELENELIYQIGAMEGICKANQVKLAHVKAHGALYNLAGADSVIAQAVARAIKAVNPDLIFVALAGSELEKAGNKEGLRVAREVFADRAYNADGSLASRKEEGAVLHDFNQVAERVARMVIEGKVQAKTGEDLEIYPDTICVHGDNPEAVKLVKRIKEVLHGRGIKIKPLAFILGLV